MDSRNNKSSELDRRTSMRQSVRLSTAAVGDDDIALAAMAMADGFRPEEETGSSSGTGTSGDTTPTQTNPQEGSQQVMQTPVAPVPPAPRSRPSSIAKPRRDESFALRHDGSMGPINERRSSRGSSFSDPAQFVIDGEAPQGGFSGPSQPFPRYQPTTPADPGASVATPSTPPAVTERPYSGPLGPTHPYGMYPQNTMGADGLVMQPIPIGFPGAGDQYRRRIGPEGEEAADLIGPDGHTEELPPYTKYPDEAYALKVRSAASQPESSGAVAPAQQIPAVSTQPASQEPSNATENSRDLPAPQPTTTTAAAPPAPPLSPSDRTSLTAREPESSTSAEDLEPPQSNWSDRSFVSRNDSQKRINSLDKEVSARQKPRWKVMAENKMWGIIPYWAICFVLSSLVVMGIVFGAVIGTVLTGGGGPDGVGADPDNTSIPATVTVTLDATPLPTKPADLEPLEVGDFSLPIVGAARMSTTCFDHESQSNSWSCTIVDSQFKMSVSFLEDRYETNNYAVSLSCNESKIMESGVYNYGTQPPCFNTNTTMDLVVDLFEPRRGPAWFFQVPFAKTVIVPESFLSTDLNANVTSSGTEFTGKEGAQVGDKPWVCVWGGTLLEMFIYANQESRIHKGYDAKVANLESSATGTTTTIVGDQPSTTVSGPATSDDGSYSEFGGQYGQWTFSGPTLPPPPYPRVVKVEERRLSGPPAQVPVCFQWEILEDGHRPIQDEDGNDVMIAISEHETEPSLRDTDDFLPEDSDYSKRSEKRSSRRRRRPTRTVHPRVLEKRSKGLYARDANGHWTVKERRGDTLLVGQDLSDCACLWWTL